MTNPADAAFSRIDFAVVSRAVRGGHAVKVAAYNASARFEYDGKAFDFRRKAERIDGCVLLPDGAPESLRDPGALWRAVEASERRVDAQLCRQVLINLPRECPPELRLGALRAVADPWRQAGMGCQIDLHCPIASDGKEQPHGHLLLTLREVTPEGLSRTKNRTWNALFRDGDGRVMRAEIDSRLNEFFEAHNIDCRVDNRSREARGLPHDLPPEPIAPQQDWQRWLREGARPEARPITVERVMQHRAARRTWERATAAAEAWGAHVTKLEQQLDAIRKENAVRVQAAIEGPTRNKQNEIQSPVKQKMAQPEREKTKMAQRPVNKTAARPESWMRGSGGFDALSDAQQRAARAAHERWIAGNELRGRHVHGIRYGLQSYVEYVQDARRKEEQATAEEAQAEREDKAPPPGRRISEPEQPDGIAPASTVVAERSRTSHLERLLAGRYAVPAALMPHARRVDLDDDGRRAVLHTAHGKIYDHGDRITNEGQTSPELAAAMVAAAAAKGWSSVKLTGSADYKAAIAIAAALAVPPLTTDHELDDQGKQTVREQLRQRATAAVPALADTTSMSPADAAKARLDHERRLARAALAGEPTGERDPRRLAAPRIAEAVAKRDRAIEDAAEAQHAAQSHREQYGWTARLLDPAARKRQAALDEEARRLFVEARRLDRGHDRIVRRIEREATHQARQHDRDHTAWQWSKEVRQARAKLDQLDTVEAAVTAGDPSVLSAAAAGDWRGAVAAVRSRQAAQEEAARAAMTPAQRREAALKACAAAEAAAGADPRKLAVARTVTAAAIAGDPAVVSAALSGDTKAAEQAAAEWKREQERLAEERRREMQQQAALDAAMASVAATGLRLEA